MTVVSIASHVLGAMKTDCSSDYFYVTKLKKTKKFSALTMWLKKEHKHIIYFTTPSTILKRSILLSFKFYAFLCEQFWHGC